MAFSWKLVLVLGGFGSELLCCSALLGASTLHCFLRRSAGYFGLRMVKSSSSSLERLITCYAFGVLARAYTSIDASRLNVLGEGTT